MCSVGAHVFGGAGPCTAPTIGASHTRPAIDTADAAPWTALDIGIRERAQPQPALLPSRARIDGRRIAWDRNEGLKVIRRGHPPLSENELVLALCHLDGRIREAVIDRVADIPELLPIAAVRDSAYDEVLGPLLGSRQPRVRSAGVTALRRAGRPAQAQPFLSDRSGLVRACARWVLRQHGTDPLPLYRALCADPSDRDLRPPRRWGWPSAARARTPYCWCRCSVTRPGRSAPVRSPVCVCSTGPTPNCCCRCWTNPSVAREVTTALLPSADRLPEAWLTLRLTADRPVHTRKAAFRLLRAQGGVAQLRAAVQLLTDQDPRLKALAGPAIPLWVVPPAGVPRGDAEVAALLDRCTHLFSDYVLARLRRELGITG
jgi:hypothetical protein